MSPRRLFLLFSILLSHVQSAPLGATSVVVPDQFPTLQAGIDSGADTVRVMPGRYHERPRLNRPLVLLAEDTAAPRPRFDGLVVNNENHVYLTARGIAFEGAVDIFTPGRDRGNRFTFEHCTLDSGVYHREAGDIADIDLFAVRHSRVRGLLALGASNPVCESDTIEAGGVAFGAEGQPIVRDCRFVGPGGTAIEILTPDFAGEIARNEIIGPYAWGIRIHVANGASIHGNRVSSCTEGITIAGDATNVTGNETLNCGIGIRFYVASALVTIADNRVLGSLTDGIRVELGSTNELLIESNIVGRSGGHGIRLDMQVQNAYYPGATVKSNTLYGNGESGLSVFAVPITYGPFALTVRQNIGHGNGEYGYAADPDVPVDSQCNDWFANVSGAVQGGLPPEDFELDPQFCDVASDSVGLAHGSPLLAMAGCGLIGARGMACATTPTLVQLFQAGFDGAAVELRWMLSEEPRELVLERAAAGSEAWRTIPVLVQRIGDVTVARDAEVEPGRVYKYRLAWRTETDEWARSAEVEVLAQNAPMKLALAPITPNPAAGPVQVQWTMPRAGDVDLRVYDLAGREIATIARGGFEAGQHTIAWNAGAGPILAAGVYFVRLRACGNVASRTFLVRF